MNVFEYLGLPADHRAKNKVVQMVKHYNEVPASKKSYPLLGQVKKDGVYCLVVVTEKSVNCFGRTGEQLSFTLAVREQVAGAYLSHGVCIGELLSKHPCSLEGLSGVVNPNRVNDLDEDQANIAKSLYVAWHDHLTIDEFINGSSNSNYRQRYERLIHCLDGTDLREDILPVVTIYDDSGRAAFTAACLAAGEEGAVYKQPAEGYVAGHKGFRQMKEVGRVDYDLECVGVEEGEGKYTNKVANLIFKWKGGKTIKAMLGKGWTHDDAALMFKAYVTNKTDHELYPIGKIFRVKGLMDSSKGKVRLPKVEEVRHDKVTADY